MFHMHSTFNLRPDVTLTEFQAAWDQLCKTLIDEGLLASASGIAERRADTPLDTDADRQLRYFTIMSFRDRPQSEAAWDVFDRRDEPTWTPHIRVLQMVADPVFACWEDLGPNGQAGT